MSNGNSGWLDKVLAETNEYIDDDGFTDAVMMQLPPGRRRNRWLNAAILIGAASLAGVVLLGSLPDQAALYGQLSELLLTRPIAGLGLFSVASSAISGLLAGLMLNVKR